uniref:Uncharacterized protein n=1 Tax=Timema monikensis TaxID=170555 RepID=A0A7R9EIP6_9NEOP|nr:unnamed protein product [Timema monikensis]
MILLSFINIIEVIIQTVEWISPFLNVESAEQSVNMSSTVVMDVVTPVGVQLSAKYKNIVQRSDIWTRKLGDAPVAYTCGLSGEGEVLARTPGQSVLSLERLGFALYGKGASDAGQTRSGDRTVNTNIE